MNNKKNNLKQDTIDWAYELYQALSTIYPNAEERMDMLYNFHGSIRSSYISISDEAERYLEDSQSFDCTLMSEIEDILMTHFNREVSEVTVENQNTKENYDYINSFIKKLHSILEDSKLRGLLLSTLYEQMVLLAPESKLCPECQGELEYEIQEEPHDYGDAIVTERYSVLECPNCDFDINAQ